MPFVGPSVKKELGVPLGPTTMFYDYKSCNTKLFGHLIGCRFYG